MATNIQPIGFLSSVGGNRTGLGEDYVRKLEGAGRPSINFTNNDFGGISDAIALLNGGSLHKHICAFRVVGKREEFSVPDYNMSPREAAIEFKERIQPRLGKEVNENKKHIWILLGNELDKTKPDWIGEWAYESARLWNQDGYKVAMVGWASGTPEPEDWKTPGWVKYLRYCAKNPEKAAVNLHEYSYIKSDIFDDYPNKIGRFQFLFKACDELGIPRVPVLIGEWGWEETRVPEASTGRQDVLAVAHLYSQFPQILGAGLWYLGPGYKNIANAAQKLIKGVGEDAARYQSAPFSRELLIDPAGGVTELAPESSEVSGAETVEKKPEAEKPRPATGQTQTVTREIFKLAYTGFGEKDVGLEKAAWVDDGNVQVPILGGQKMTYWAAEGENRFGDGQPWNEFKLPEGVHRWDSLLPEQDHKFLNEVGRCYHLFAPQGAWWTRFSRRTQLEPGTYRLKLDLYGDWVDIKGGVKHPKTDPQHARVELFMDEAGREDWQIPVFNEANLIEKSFTVDQAGEVEVGFGILTVFAPGGGATANGCFIRSFTLEQIAVEETEPVDDDGGDETGETLPGPEDEPVGLEISRQVMQLAPPAGSDLVRLVLSTKESGHWQAQKAISQALAGDLQLEIVFLKGTEKTRAGSGPKSSRTSGVITAPDEKVLGMDLSMHQAQNIDFDRAAEAGVEYCFIRAGSGKTEKDANYEHNFREAGRVGMLRGIYYYLYPEEKATVGMATERTPEGQARRFAALLKDNAELGAVLDIEEEGLTPHDVKRFVDEFQKHDPYGRPITIYTAGWFWNKGRGFAGPAVDWAADHPLWVAAYTHNEEPIQPAKDFRVHLPDPWRTYAVHQWTSKGGNLVGQKNKPLDLNYFPGSLEALKQWGQTGALSGTLKAGGKQKGAKHKFVTASAGLHLREGPSSDDTSIRLLDPGTKVEVLEEGDWDRVRVGSDIGYTSSKWLTAKKPTGQPILTDAGVYRYRGPQVSFFTGMHGPASDASWLDEKFKEMIRRLNMPLVFMSNGINHRFADFGDRARNVVRLVWNPRAISADEAYEDIRDDQLRHWWNKGYRRFFFFNEVQLSRAVTGQSEEGFGISWQSAEEFAPFLRTCLTRARAEFPDIVLYTTPMTPNAAFDPWHWRETMWAQVKDLVDGWCMHAYTGNQDDPHAAAQEIANEVIELQKRLRLQIPIIVSEAAVNRGNKPHHKAQVARLLPEKLAHVPGVEAVYWYAADWAADMDKNHEGWFRNGIADAFLALV